MSRNTTARLFMTVLFAGTALAGSTGAGVAQLQREAFMQPIASPPPRGLVAFSGPEMRSAAVDVRPEMLVRAPDGQPVRLTLVPFEGALFEVELEPRIDLNEGEIWVGRVVGQPASRAHFRRVGSSLAGGMRTRDGILQVLPDGAGRAVVLQATGPPLPDVVTPAPDELRRDVDRVVRTRKPAPEETSRIDLLVIMEKQALNETQGLGGWLKSAIRTGVLELNLGLADSGVNAEFNLQTIKRDRYGLTGDDIGFSSQLLTDTTNANDSRMKKTQRLREKFGSDIVAVIMGRNSGVCGQGWVTGDRGEGVQPEDAPLGFSVTSWRCLVGGTLAHEIGHNMGGQHSYLDPTSDFLGAYDYSYGHKINLKFYTIMAYNCDFCTAALLFSTPDVDVEGEPAGVGGGAQPANNARGFERDREIIAGFRECKRACN